MFHVVYESWIAYQFHVLRLVQVWCHKTEKSVDTPT